MILNEYAGRLVDRMCESVSRQRDDSRVTICAWIHQQERYRAKLQDLLDKHGMQKPQVVIEGATVRPSESLLRKMFRVPEAT